MAEINTVAVDLHVKRYSDFDLLRIAKAVSQDYEVNFSIFQHESLFIQPGVTTWTS